MRGQGQRRPERRSGAHGARQRREGERGERRREKKKREKKKKRKGKRKIRERKGRREREGERAPAAIAAPIGHAQRSRARADKATRKGVGGLEIVRLEQRKIPGIRVQGFRRILSSTMKSFEKF